MTQDPNVYARERNRREEKRTREKGNRKEDKDGQEEKEIAA